MAPAFAPVSWHDSDMLLRVLALCATAHAQSVTGVWHAAVKLPNGDLAGFQLQLEQRGNAWSGALVNGPDREQSSSGTFDGQKLRLVFNHWDGVLEADFDGTKFTGVYTRTWRKEIRKREFLAQRQPLLTPKLPPAVDVSGEWTLEVTDAGKRSIWKAQFAQKGSRLEGTLLPVSGDSGLLSGFVEGRSLRVSRFDGIRSTLLAASVGTDGALTGMMDGSATVRGRRAKETSEKPPEATAYTRMKNPSERFQFSFPDLNGNRLSAADPRFQGKVVLINIMGSWCPNCHEEIPLLKELWAKFHDKGLEIISLAFEYTGEAERDIRQLKLFQARYQPPYPILYAGATEDIEKTLPQLENFGAYPTNIYIGRDGKVKLLHAGFDGPSTGARHARLKREITELVGKLVQAR